MTLPILWRSDIHNGINLVYICLKHNYTTQLLFIDMYKYTAQGSNAMFIQCHIPLKNMQYEYHTFIKYLTVEWLTNYIRKHGPITYSHTYTYIDVVDMFYCKTSFSGDQKRCNVVIIVHVHADRRKQFWHVSVWWAELCITTHHYISPKNNCLLFRSTPNELYRL